MIEVSAIVAVAINGVIGNQNQLPWYLPKDLQYFKRVTIGKPLIMGRKTYQSIVARLGKPLSNREHIVISNQINLHGSQEFSNVHWVSNIDTAIHVAQQLMSSMETTEIMVVGGASIYELAMPKINKIYLTKIELEPLGDVHFVIPEHDEWSLVDDQGDIDQGVGLRFQIYTRNHHLN